MLTKLLLTTCPGKLARERGQQAQCRDRKTECRYLEAQKGQGYGGSRSQDREHPFGKEGGPKTGQNVTDPC